MRSIPVRWATKGRVTKRRVLAVVAVAVFAMTPGLNSGAGTENESAFSRRNPIVIAVQKTRDGIVTIKVPRAGANTVSTRDLVGTGVIVDERGYVVTNRHVIGSASRTSGGTLKVQLADGANLSAEVVAAETALDMAILKLHTKKKLAFLPLAPVSDLMVGETVIAVGHPFGYTNTVSKGIISALNRAITMPTGDVLAGLIQTDASINPGNSGGPLLNINGELIGINVALREGAQGIAFAINAGTVKKFLSKHLNAHRLAGVNHSLNLKEKVVAETGDRQRVLVAEYSPRACAKLQPGDEVRAVADRAIVNAFDVERALWDKKPGQSVNLKIVRNGQELTLQLTLLPGDGAGQLASADGGSSSLPSSIASSVPVGNRP